MFKRFFYFAAVNIAIIAMVSLILNVLGVRPYLTANGLNYQSLLIFCLVWGMVGSFISLFISKWTAKKFMGVKLLDPNTDQTGLVNRVHQFARSAGINKMPEVGVYDSPEVNAFATGPSKNNSLVAVSTGLLNRMSQDEVDGVLAHEVAHVANGDMVTLALIQGVINAFVMFLARVAAFFVSNALRSDDDERGGSSYLVQMVLIFAFEILFGILGSIIVAFFSRFREYRADSGGAKLAGREKMISALKSLQRQFEGGQFDKRTENMNAFKISAKDTGFRALFSTHPSLSDRIKALEMNR